MVFAGLIVSLGILGLTWLITILADCGLSIGMILLYPFLGLIEKIYNAFDTRTDEEILEKAKAEAEFWRPARSYDEIKKEAIDKFFK